MSALQSSSTQSPLQWFPLKLYHMLEESGAKDFDHIISWQASSSGDESSFLVHHTGRFTEEILPKYFAQSKYKSFQRQLNIYGWKRIQFGPSKGGYKHPYFVRRRKDLLHKIFRCNTNYSKNNKASLSLSSPLPSPFLRFDVRQSEEQQQDDAHYIIAQHTTQQQPNKRKIRSKLVEEEPVPVSHGYPHQYHADAIHSTATTTSSSLSESSCTTARGLPPREAPPAPPPPKSSLSFSSNLYTRRSSHSPPHFCRQHHHRYPTSRRMMMGEDQPPLALPAPAALVVERSRQRYEDGGRYQQHFYGQPHDDPYWRQQRRREQQQQEKNGFHNSRVDEEVADDMGTPSSFAPYRRHTYTATTTTTTTATSDPLGRRTGDILTPVTTNATPTTESVISTTTAATTTTTAPLQAQCSALNNNEDPLADSEIKAFFDYFYPSGPSQPSDTAAAASAPGTPLPQEKKKQPPHAFFVPSPTRPCCSSSSSTKTMPLSCAQEKHETAPAAAARQQRLTPPAVVKEHSLPLLFDAEDVHGTKTALEVLEAALLFPPATTMIIAAPPPATTRITAPRGSSNSTEKDIRSYDHARREIVSNSTTSLSIEDEQHSSVALDPSCFRDSCCYSPWRTDDHAAPARSSRPTGSAGGKQYKQQQQQQQHYGRGVYPEPEGGRERCWWQGTKQQQQQQQQAREHHHHQQERHTFVVPPLVKNREQQRDELYSSKVLNIDKELNELVGLFSNDDDCWWVAEKKDAQQEVVSSSSSRCRGFSSVSPPSHALPYQEQQKEEEQVEASGKKIEEQEKRPYDDGNNNMMEEDNTSTSSFPFKLHLLLDNAEKDKYANVISWVRNGRAFKVHDFDEFVRRVMPLFFDQSKYESFRRQLNLYGFARIPRGKDRGIISHPHFVQGNRRLCADIKRKTSNSGSKMPEQENNNCSPEGKS